MRIHSIGFCAAALLAVAALSCGIPPIPEYSGVALVYGISIYDTAAGEGVGVNLSYPDDDARAMAEALRQSGYAVITRTNAEATRPQLEADLQAAADIAGDGLFVFYFSGHGIRPLPDGSGETVELILLHGHTGGYFNAVSASDLRSLIADVPTAKRLVVIDSCYSGGFINRQYEVDRRDEPNTAAEAFRRYASSADDVAGAIPASQALVISASGRLEYSYESASLGHGIFTYYFLEAATLGDANGDGVVSAMEAYAYATARIGALWPSLEFLPRFSGGPVDFVLFF